MITANMLRRALANVTDAEAAAIWESLGQFVENCEDCDEETDVPRLAGARDVLDRLNAELAALAEPSPRRYSREEAEMMRDAYGNGSLDLPW